MIARFRYHLALTLYRQPSESLAPATASYAPYRVTFYPPLQSKLCMVAEHPEDRPPLLSVLEMLAPNTPEIVSSFVKINEAPAIPCDLLQIDVAAPGFDRRLDTGEGVRAYDPPDDLFFTLSNSLLRRIRTVGQVPGLDTADPYRRSWYIEYLADDGSELQIDPALFRRRFALLYTGRATAVTAKAWATATSLPIDFISPTWGTLFVEANSLLPQVGAPIVLAYTAIETAVARVLDHLASAIQPPELWAWVNDRGDYRKEPSVLEQCDSLLNLLGGRSLKSQPALWEAFRNLRDARNSYVHSGVAEIGGRRLGSDDAQRLLAKAGEILVFLEQFLPRELRRPIDESLVYFSFMAPIAIAKITPAAG